MAKVSVIIPSYGRPELLKKSILSVVSQTFTDWELIVVDDNGSGSPSQIETQRVLEEFKSDSRISYLIQESNRGGAAARNRGWQAAKGSFVCFLDNDDEFYPEKLAVQYSTLAGSTYQMSVCGFESFKNGKKVRVSSPIVQIDDFLMPFAQGEINFASGSTLMVTKKLLEKVGGYDVDFGRKQDVELMIRLLTIEKLSIEERVLVRLNIDDRSNIPTVENFLRFQNLFRVKFEPLFSQFPENVQNQIKQFELIELSKVALWNKDWKLFFSVFLRRGLNWKNQLFLAIDLGRKFATYYFN